MPLAYTPHRQGGTFLTHWAHYGGGEVNPMRPITVDGNEAVARVAHRLSEVVAETMEHFAQVTGRRYAPYRKGDGVEGAIVPRIFNAGVHGPLSR